MTPPLERYLSAGLTYDAVGGTRTGAVPPGYHRLSRRFLLGAAAEAPVPDRAAGTGQSAAPDLMSRAADAVLTFGMHRAAGMRVAASAPRAAPGVTLVGSVGAGPLRMVAPCRVVWAVEPGPGVTRAGFGYGTLPGHPERGEEAFTVSWEAGGQVWFTVQAFSQAACWYSRLGGPVVPVLQSLWAARCAASLRRLAS